MISRVGFLRRLAAAALALACTVSPLWAQERPVADAASAADAATTAVPPVAPSTGTADNPYGLSALWQQGDLVARSTLVMLLLMSMGSWYVLLTKLYESLKLARESAVVKARFFKAASLASGAEGLNEGSAYRFIADSGLQASHQYDDDVARNIDRNSWVTLNLERSVATVQSRLQDGLALLATVGSTAPFIGLFGTVWGIYHALTAIGIAGQASIDKVAGPVGEALIMTAIGLAVAVPAVLGYNALVRRNKTAMEGIRGFAADLHGALMGAKR